MTSATWLLMRRTLVQFPRNPMVLGFSVAPVLMMFVVFGRCLRASSTCRVFRPTTTSSTSRRRPC